MTFRTIFSRKRKKTSGNYWWWEGGGGLKFPTDLIINAVNHKSSLKLKDCLHFLCSNFSLGDVVLHNLSNTDYTGL